MIDGKTGDKVGKGILGAFLLLLGIVVVLGGIYLTVYINAIILGSVFQVAANESLPVTNDTLNFLGTTETSFFSANNSVLSGLTFATSLIPIAVILLVLGGAILGGYAGYKYMKKKRGMGGGGDLGY